MVLGRSASSDGMAGTVGYGMSAWYGAGKERREGTGGGRCVTRRGLVGSVRRLRTGRSGPSPSAARRGPSSGPVRLGSSIGKVRLGSSDGLERVGLVSWLGSDLPGSSIGWASEDG